jgi:hypothetical protein
MMDPQKSNDGPPFLLELLKKAAQKPRPNVVPPGRTYFVAHIPIESWEFEALRIKYQEILQELTYREAIAWCRGLGFKWSTFLMRKYRHRAPRLEEIILTVGWYDAGKPVQRKNRHTVAHFILGD